MTEHTEESVRAEVRAWLDSNWDQTLRCWNGATA